MPSLAMLDSPQRQVCSTLQPRKSVAAFNAPTSLSKMFHDHSGQRFVRPRELVFLQGDHADSVYQIVSGTVQCCLITESGHRQILRFAGSGEYLAFSALETYHFTAEAVDKVIVRGRPREEFERALARSAELQRELRTLICLELSNRDQQLMSFTQLPSTERLEAFLKTYTGARPTDRDGYTVLPMTRNDLGDYLGMSLETVSRAFGTLKRSGRIHLKGCDRYRFLDLASANRLAV